ncbi:MAG: carboxypeptidase-like regulatory domain-containing protein [Actinomycetota bacterium]
MANRLVGRRALSLLVVLTTALSGSVASAQTRGARSSQDVLSGRIAPIKSIHLTANGSSRQTATPARTPSDYLKGQNTHTIMRTQSFIEAERKALSSKFGINFPDPIAEALKQRAARKAAGLPTYSFSFHLLSAYPAGDLDGDGLVDLITQDTLITVTFDPNLGIIIDITSDVIKATKGTTGETLWTISAQHGFAGFALPVGDLTGSHSDDVLLINYLQDPATGPNTCAVVACAEAQTVNYRWITNALSGKDASLLWSRTFSGTASIQGAFAFGIVALAEGYVFQSTNYLVVPETAPDENGDGKRDLVYNAFDVTELFALGIVAPLVAEVLGGVDQLLITTHADLTEGGDGTQLLTESYGPDLSGAQLSPAGNADGDSTGDLLWVTYRNEFTPFVCAFALVGGCAYEQRTQAVVSMIDGGNLKTAWTTTINDPTIGTILVQPALADLNGDGHDDLLFDELSGPSVLPTEQQGAISGADGSTIWTQQISGFPFIAGPITGGSGQDLFFLLGSFNSSGGIDLSTTRVGGKDGKILFNTTHSFSNPNGFLDVVGYLPGDMNGDGVQDIVFDSINLDFNTSAAHSSMLAESGKTGSALATRDIDTVAFTSPAGDLDGDGTVDLYDTQVDPNLPATHTKTILMPAGAPSWSRDDSFASSSFFTVIFGIGDLNGDGRTDALYLRDELDPVSGNELYRFDALSGVDGGVLWGFGDTLPTGTPPVNLGSIAGTVSDSNGPLANICVQATSSAGAENTTTSADGSYTLTGLNPSTYIVSFTDCATNTHGAQWYNGQAIAANADPVVVGSGVSVTGIDALLTLIPPPANDNIANATVIPGTPFDEQTNNAGATVENGETSQCPGGLTNTIWYKYTTGSVPLELGVSVISQFPSAVNYYEGTDPSNLTQHSCGSSYSFLASPNTTYWFQVGSESGSGGRISFELTSLLVQG